MYKCLTHDFRPPIQGGEPVWDGVTLPYELPRVVLDTSDADCAPGWYAVERIEDAIPVVGLWPDGWPVCVLEVESVGRVHVPPGGKPRAEGMRLLRRVGVDETMGAVRRWTATWAGDLTDELTQQQGAWYEALGRPGRDEAAAEAGLMQALAARGLSWQLGRYDTAQAARGAWDAWAARAAWNAWDAWDARAALSVYCGARLGWIAHAPDLPTRGIRDAYRAGLAIAGPVDSTVLGWAMVERRA